MPRRMRTARCLRPLGMRVSRGSPAGPRLLRWQRLNSHLNGELQGARSFLQPCRIDPGSDARAAVMRDAKNPFAIADHAGGTQSTGWLGAWRGPCRKAFLTRVTGRSTFNGELRRGEILDGRPNALEESNRAGRSPPRSAA